ncbi:serine hydrolase domain-containing protein [Nocardioides mesophilus]|uniref:Beta-lactamase family protein n=1 Tax=Nocardioides mesophilus TaxID=433659 RepID=A0A7G9RAS4_9ACTN|nr:serine hydrolase domain-containing protein [Nocardioides mesophilus]QNN52699.1 beta-lactamase family protein [Nocardioides mesophilus]
MSVAQSTARRLQALVATDQVQGRLPSLVAGVVRDGALVWTGAHGAVTGTDATPGPDVQFRIGSITKTLVAVVVLQLREQGRLDLNDPLEKHLPGVAYGDRTIRSLLSHSSGMHSEPAGDWWERSPGVSFDQLAERLADVPAAFPSGATFHYTNIAFGLLGEVVARLTGGTWFDAVRERVLEPLDMRRTTYLPAGPAARGFSVHHLAGTLTEEPAHDAGAMAPAGQVWSTIEDLARYAAFLAAAESPVLPSSAMREMTTPQSGTQAGGMSGGYGLGFRLAAGGSGTLVGHTGSMPGFLAGLFADRPRRTGAVLLANGTSGLRCEGLAVDLLTTLESCEPTIPPAWTPTTGLPASVSEVLGVWHWGNTAYEASWRGEELVFRMLGNGVDAHAFALTADGTFVGSRGYHHGERLQVVRADDGRVSHLVCATFVYTRTPYDPEVPIPGGHPAL